MLIHEVCRECSLTKKAIAYYIEQGLISPGVQENGYRVFTEKDVQRLQKISVLRDLGVSVAEMEAVLSDTDTALLEIAKREMLHLSVLREKQALMEELANHKDWMRIQDKLEQLNKKQSVLERLMQAFPGYYGKFICFHFAAYLEEPVITAEQQEAFCEVLEFLDNVNFDVPENLRQFLEETTAKMDEAFLKKMETDMKNAVKDTKKYLEENHEEIEKYIAFTQSEDYKKTPAYQLKQALQRFYGESGYYDIFIPAMRRLSPSYDDFQQSLAAADELFLREYPQWEGG